MHRSGLFWKVLLPGAGLILAAALVMAADTLSPAVELLLLALLIAAAVFHARWVTQLVTDAAGSLAESIRRMGEDAADARWNDRQPAEVTPLIDVVQTLERRLRDRISALEQTVSSQADATALIETTLKTMVEGVVVLDRKHHILFTNKAARPLLDMQVDDVLGRPLWEVARLSSIHKIVERVLEDGETINGEYKVPRTKRMVAVTAAALPHNPVPGAMLVLHDVTDLRRLETMRRDFVSNVSHELKTPLTSIQAYADTLLESGFAVDDESRHFLAKIIEQSERLAEIIVDVIRLGKIESSHDVFDVQPVEVLPVVTACVDAHAKVAETQGIVLSVESLPADAVVLADAGELRTILDNLVDNALSYTPADGTVTLRLAVDESAPLVGIAVADTGIGIPKDQQARVFERFHRVDRARDRQRGGTGLGLSIVKHLCQVFGGRIDLESELGAGSTFTVWLPLANPVDKALTATKSGGAKSPEAARIDPAPLFTES